MLIDKSFKQTIIYLIKACKFKISVSLTLKIYWHFHTLNIYMIMKGTKKLFGNILMEFSEIKLWPQFVATLFIVRRAHALIQR